MAKIKTFIYEDGTVHYLYKCPGCGFEHAFGLKNHKYNKDENKPTISPSLLNNFNPQYICHSFIKEGKIEFLSDCWHTLKGQTVDLPDYPEGEVLLIDYSNSKVE